MKVDGEHIKQARNDKGLSQTQLSELMGVSSQTVSNWESGRTSLSLARLSKLAKLTDKSPEWFLVDQKTSTDSDDSDKGQLLDLFDKLNEHAKALLLNYANDLASLSKYQK